ncbi:MAG: PQQ-dependent sugar dehydrogenase [Planctomycetaceae bacterium]
MLRRAVNWVGVTVLLLGALAAADERPESRPQGLPRERVMLTGSRVVGSPEPPLPYEAVVAYPELKARKPVFLVADPERVRSAVRDAPGLPFDEYERFIVGEHQNGMLLSFSKTGTGRKAFPFLKAPGVEVLSMAFHPQYTKNRLVFFYTHRENPQTKVRTLRVVRYRVALAPPNACEPDSEKVLMEWETKGHTGGSVLFGPDGMLYISAGDGSAGEDRQRSGQDISDWNASILRIDVDREAEGRPYAIPPDNPFLDVPGARGEVWAFGLRNPWRMHFDPEGRLWVGDVGQDRYEAILIVEKGDNFGWSLYEAGEPYDLDRKQGPAPIKKPAIVHTHREARSIIGGVTYQGSRLPELRGAYLYADHITGTIWAARVQSNGVVQSQKICETGRMISSFSLDSEGEAFFLDYRRSEICRLEPTPPPSRPEISFPLSLSETGLFKDVSRHEMDPGVIPYEVNSELWSDGAVKRRWIALPQTGQVQFDPLGLWKFPEGTVFIKSFGRPLRDGVDEPVRWVETRLMVIQKGRWAGYSYRWNESGTDADLVGADGDQTTLSLGDGPDGEVEWHWSYPSRSQCFSCHTEAANFVLGFTIPQLNRPIGNDEVNQLAAFESLGLFAPTIAKPADPRAPKSLTESSQRRKSRSFPGESRRQFEDQVAPGQEQSQKSPARLSGGQKSPDTPQRTGSGKVANKVASPNPQPISLVAGRLPDRPERLPRMVNPLDSNAPLDLRARSYLDTNCGHCHRESGGGNSKIRLLFERPSLEMNIVGMPPEHGELELKEARIAAPGNPDRSILLERMRRRGKHQMPPLGSALPDTAGIERIEAWIDAQPP